MLGQSVSSLCLLRQVSFALSHDCRNKLRPDADEAQFATANLWHGDCISTMGSACLRRMDMARKTVAELSVDVLAEAGVESVYGVPGDSLNGITDSIRVRQDISWVGVRHEEAAAFAADAEAHLTGKLAVCAGSCGPGNMHLINGLYDCQRSRVPVLAIAAQIPSREIGSAYFQETDPKHIFAQCSHYCELVSEPEQMPRILETAIQTAISKRGVSVIVLPGDVALKESVQGPRVRFHEQKSSVCPSDEELNRLAGLLNRSK